MIDAYWMGLAERQIENDYRIPAINVKQSAPRNRFGEDVEYVYAELFDGETVRFKREWSGYRFTDSDVNRLAAGMEIRVNSKYVRGVIGSLEWQSYNGHDFYGFSPWSMEAYNRENAPFPYEWSNHVFTDDEELWLRAGYKVLIVCVSSRSGSTYAVHVSFTRVTAKDGSERWGINPHFEEFNQPASNFTRENCPFKPVFGTKTLTQAEIAHVRAGGGIPYSGISKTGRPYNCHLVLKLDTTRSERWCLSPVFS